VSAELPGTAAAPVVTSDRVLLLVTRLNGEGLAWPRFRVK
jgi:hypothetical protein